MSKSALRPRSVTEIVDAAFQIYRTHLGALVMCSAIAYVPMLLVRFVLIGDPRRFQTAGQMSNLLLVSGATSLLSILSYGLMTAALTVCASQAYLGEEVDVGRAIRMVVPRLGAVIVSTMIVSIMAFIGFCLFFIPGFYVSARYFAVTPAVVLEGRGVRSCFERSTELSKGRKLHILNTLGLVLLIYIVFLIGLSIVSALAGGFVIQSIFGAIVTICLYPAIAITSTLLYYDARIQSEGLDIERMADALGPVAMPALS